jgi:hypothetical protein
LNSVPAAKTQIPAAGARAPLLSQLLSVFPSRVSAAIAASPPVPGLGSGPNLAGPADMEAKAGNLEVLSGAAAARD